ncbi:MAG: hypothetical protein AAF578_13095 [Pseudomonadota bacterium]
MLSTVNYLIYIVLSIGITIAVARTLSVNGLPFLVRSFSGDVELARSTNHLLVVGFYLINIGFVLKNMRVNASISDINSLIVYQASEIGFVLLVVGFMHFLNMYLIRKSGSDMQRWAGSAEKLDSKE